MNLLRATGLAMLALLLAGAAGAQAAAPIPRTPEGRPDFHGVWENRWLTRLEKGGRSTRLW